MEEDEILAALRTTNERRCDPLLEVVEVKKIAASVARYEPAGDVVHVSFNGHGSARLPRGYTHGDTTSRASVTPSGSSRTTARTSGTVTRGGDGSFGPVPGESATTSGEYTSLRKRPSAPSTGRPPIPKTKTDARP
jgi:Primase C terminal 1 (PriCT-1)